MLKAGIKVPKNHDLIGKNIAMWKVSIIPDCNHPDERFALVVSMSHVAGDAFVTYKLHSMLSEEADVLELNPVRRFDVNKAAA